MDSASQDSTFFVGSASSSVYSDNDLISLVNSTGTQVHHRSHLQPTLGGMPRENGQNFERLSILSLRQDESSPNPRDGNLNREVLSSSNALYRFETSEEAAARYRQEVASARTYAHENWRDTKLRSAHYSNYQSQRTVDDLDISIRRPSIPTTRRPRGRRTVSYSSLCNTVLSAELAPSRSLTDVGDLAERYIGETTSLHGTLQDDWRTTIAPPTPLPRAILVSQNPSELELEDLDLSARQCQSQRDAALQALSGSVPNDINFEEPADSGYGRIRASLDRSNIARRQGKVDWREGLRDDRPLRVSLISTTGQEYGLGGHTRGYTSGGYTTKVGDPTSTPEETVQKRRYLKRLFCFSN